MNDILLDWNVATKEKLEEIVADVVREIDEDCAWAESSPMPEPSRRRTVFLITTSCRRRLDQKFWSQSQRSTNMSTAVKKEHKSARPERGGQATIVEAIRQGIWEEMERDPTVFVIGEDVGVYGGAFKVTDGLIDEFGKERVIDTPISEGAIVGAACGAALMGMRPVAEFQFIDFISAGFDLLTNYAAKCRYRWGAGISGGVSWSMWLGCAIRTISLAERRSRFS